MPADENYTCSICEKQLISKNRYLIIIICPLNYVYLEGCRLFSCINRRVSAIFITHKDNRLKIEGLVCLGNAIVIKQIGGPFF